MDLFELFFSLSQSAGQAPVMVAELQPDGCLCKEVSFHFLGRWRKFMFLYFIIFKVNKEKPWEMNFLRKFLVCSWLKMKRGILIHWAPEPTMLVTQIPLLYQFLWHFLSCHSFWLLPSSFPQSFSSSILLYVLYKKSLSKTFFSPWLQERSSPLHLALKERDFKWEWILQLLRILIFIFWLLIISIQFYLKISSLTLYFKIWIQSTYFSLCIPE